MAMACAAASASVVARASTSAASPQTTSLAVPRSYSGLGQSFAARLASQNVAVANGAAQAGVKVSSSKRRAVVSAALELEMSLETESGVSLEALRAKLDAGEWEAADEETRLVLRKLAGEEAVKRTWIFFSEVQFIPAADLKLIDALWRKYSNNKFGYSVQRKIWNNAGKNWNAFFKKVAWTRPLDEYQDTYKKFPLEFTWDVADPTPEGHLPLTNALRGTRLLENLLNHPAFADVDEQQKLKSEPDLSGLFGNSNKTR